MIMDFWQIGQYIPRYNTGRDSHGKWKKELYEQHFTLISEEVTHKRTTYDLVGLLGDMGGIQGILISLLGILVVPISAHSFNVKAARKLFMARSTDKDLFEEIPEDQKGPLFDSKMISQ